jgi:arabinofuranosyltransferase
LPNTAYAKLNTGIAQPLLWAQGFEYLNHTLRRDPITIAITLAVPLLACRAGGAQRALALGVVLNLLYVMSVGGDFMQGRFVSVAYLLSVIVCALMLKHGGLVAASAGRRALMPLIAAAGIAGLVMPTAPLRTGRDFHDTTIHPNGIANERGYFFQLGGLPNYLARGQRTTCFVAQDWTSLFGTPVPRVLLHDYIGYAGRCGVALEQMMIDAHALSDPFLARIPLEPGMPWRIGHFKRALPEGYVESVETGENRIRDPRLHRLLDEVWLKTREPHLLSSRRIRVLLGLSPTT